MPRLIDSHSHLDASQFDADRAQVLARADAAGVIAQIVPATSAASWPALGALCATQTSLHAAYGLHPMFLAAHEQRHLQALETLLECDTHCVAVGECGLDYFMPDFDRARQQIFFDAQLAIAVQRHLPVIVHARRALDAVLASLRRHPGLRGVVHSFSGSAQQAAQLWDRGFMLGIGGPVTYARAQRLRGIVAHMPIEFLLLETDSPDQPDCDWRGQRNEPARLPRILAEVAQLRGESAPHVAAATAANARRLFGLVPAATLRDTTAGSHRFDAPTG
jgi:TatD DNase family protein